MTTLVAGWSGLRSEALVLATEALIKTALLRSSPCVTGGKDENRALHLYAPLDIKESISNEADMASYQSPWDDGQYKAACKAGSGHRNQVGLSGCCCCF